MAEHGPDRIAAARTPRHSPPRRPEKAPVTGPDKSGPDGFGPDDGPDDGHHNGPDDGPALIPGESRLAEWRPVFALFLRRLLVTSGLTALALCAAALTMIGPQGPLWAWALALPLAMALAVFLFDDFEEWPRRRGDRWTLTDRRLIYRDASGVSAPWALPLERIERMRPWMGWALRLRLVNGQTLVLSYLPEIAAVRARIAAARDALNPSAAPPPAEEDRP